MEGSGGGHIPDLIGIVREPNVFCSSTTPTIPYGPSTAAEQPDMKLIVHEGNPSLPDDVAAARELVHPATMEAEGPLHDLGAISIVNSDSQGMGRIGETVRRTFQLAHAMKAAAATREGRAEDGRDDNERVLRYLAKVTEEPARVHGISDEVGSLAPGRLADLVLWEASSFGVKPVMVFKGGVVAWSAMGEGNASVHGAQPTRYGADWGATGVAPAALATTFVSAASLDAGIADTLAYPATARRRSRDPRDPSRGPCPEPDGARDRCLTRRRNRDPRRERAAMRSGLRGAPVPAVPAGVAQSRLRIASAAISKYSSKARRASSGGSVASTAARMWKSQRSRSAGPTANGACRIRRRGCPRSAS